MLPVYICENNENQLNLIVEAVRLYFEIKHPDITAHIYKFTDPHQLLEEMNEHKEHNIYFLDYKFNCSMNGLELAKAIRKLDPLGPISFISTNEECWWHSHKYRIYAMNFISKKSPDLQRQISDALDASINYINAIRNITFESNNPIIKIKSGRTIHQIEKKKIIYFTSSEKEHIIDVYTKRLVVHPRDTLINLINSLHTDYFFLCNRTSVINLNYIDAINTKDMTVTVVGKDFPLSKSKLKELKNIMSKRDRGF